MSTSYTLGSPRYIPTSYTLRSPRYIPTQCCSQHIRIYRGLYTVGDIPYAVGRMLYMVWTTSMSPTPYTFCVVHDIYSTAYAFRVVHGIYHMLPTLYTTVPHGINEGRRHMVWTIHEFGVLCRVYNFHMPWGCRFCAIWCGQHICCGQYAVDNMSICRG